MGNWIVKSPELDDLSEPKSRTATALSDCVELYIKAPLAVIVEVLKVVSAKSVKAVVPEEVGVTFVSELPPAEYPVPVVSLVVAYAVVAAPNVAEEVYNASLNVAPVPADPPPDPFVKLCTPCKISVLKLVHIA